MKQQTIKERDRPLEHVRGSHLANATEVLWLWRSIEQQASERGTLATDSPQK